MKSMKRLLRLLERRLRRLLKRSCGGGRAAAQIAVARAEAAAARVEAAAEAAAQIAAARAEAAAAREEAASEAAAQIAKQKEIFVQALLNAGISQDAVSNICSRAKEGVPE